MEADELSWYAWILTTASRRRNASKTGSLVSVKPKRSVYRTVGQEPVVLDPLINNGG